MRLPHGDRSGSLQLDAFRRRENVRGFADERRNRRRDLRKSIKSHLPS